VEGVVRVTDRPAAGDPGWQGETPDPGSSRAPWRVYNIGNDRPIELRRLLAILEAETGRRAEVQYGPEQPGEVPATWANVDDLCRDVGFAPATPIEEGIRKFVAWYREFYRV